MLRRGPAMNGIELINERLEQIGAEIALLESERDDLEHAVEILATLQARSRGTRLMPGYTKADAPKSEGQPLNGKATFNAVSATAAAMVTHVLTVRDPKRVGMHYAQIFKAAQHMGWPGKEETLRRTLNKRPEEFASTGAGSFRLVSEGDEADE
jgi:hypothetical protein